MDPFDGHVRLLGNLCGDCIRNRIWIAERHFGEQCGVQLLVGRGAEQRLVVEEDRGDAVQEYERCENQSEVHVQPSRQLHARVVPLSLLLLLLQRRGMCLCHGRGVGTGILLRDRCFRTWWGGVDQGHGEGNWSKGVPLDGMLFVYGVSVPV